MDNPAGVAHGHHDLALQSLKRKSRNEYNSALLEFLE